MREVKDKLVASCKIWKDAGRLSSATYGPVYTRYTPMLHTCRRNSSKACWKLHCVENWTALFEGTPFLCLSARL